MKIVKISICGGLGKMGKLLINKVIKNKKLKLESITDKKNTISIQGINIQGNNINAFKNTDDQHHKKKIDYPSGTALMLANAISKGKNKKLELMKGKIFLNSKKSSPKKNKINFYITRKGNTIGKHSINFKNKIENIELKHTAFSRELFADGALKAAIWIRKKKKGLFDMQDMLNLK